jgi:hypothetical protein
MLLTEKLKVLIVSLPNAFLGSDFVAWLILTSLVAMFGLNSFSLA